MDDLPCVSVGTLDGLQAGAGAGAWKYLLIGGNLTPERGDVRNVGCG